jgi:prolyl oligopeptidase
VLFRDESPRCMQFIERQNTRVVASLPSFSALTSDFKTILDMDKAARYDRVSRDGEYFYELLSNKAYPRGVWRRVKLEALVALASPTFSGSRAEVDKAVEWELLLDVEALSKKEGKVWALSSLPETFESVALVRLSDGGKDAVICREFDLNRRQFLDESPNAFHVLKEGRTTISYVNKDTTLIGADFGSDTLTESLYPRTVKLWKRGQELSELGEPLFEGTFKDVFMSWQAQSHEPKNQLFTRFIDFFFSKKFLRLGGQGPLLPVPCDDECKVTLWKEFILLELRVDFAGFVAGSLLAAPADLFLQKGSSVLRCIFLPSATRILEGVSHTRDFVVLSVLNNVLPEVVALQPLADGSWKEIKVHVPGLGSVNLVSLWDSESDLYPNAFLMFYRDFLTPSTVFLLHDPASQPCVMIRSPSTFDASGCTAEQRFGVSKDGTVIPYFLVLPAKRENKPLKCLIDVISERIVLGYKQSPVIYAS